MLEELLPPRISQVGELPIIGDLGGMITHIDVTAQRIHVRTDFSAEDLWRVEEIIGGTVVRDVLPLVAHVLKQKSVRLSTRLAARRSVGVNVFDLEQVLINLIVNAANAVGDDGLIEIATTDAENGGVMISVRDNGPGMAPEQLKRIFDPFFTTDPRRGIGLGLSVSYGLVSRYGGHITVESRLGQGSVFRVTLLRRPVRMDEAVIRPADGRISTAAGSN